MSRWGTQTFDIFGWVRWSLCIIALWSGSFAPAHAQTDTCVVPDILFVVDLSGSMDWGVDGTATGIPTKIQALREAYTEILKKFDKQVRFGLVTFRSLSSPNGTQPYFDCATCKGCSLCAGEVPWVQVQVPIAEDTTNQCIQALNSLPAAGCTSTYPALQMAARHYQLDIIPKDANKKRPRFVILMTDGIPNVGCPNQSWTCTNPENYSACGGYLESQIRSMRTLVASHLTHDIKTFVIGFGKVSVSTTYLCYDRCPMRSVNVDANLLNRMAQAGGTGTYYQADNLTQLKSAFQDIIDKARNVEVCDGKDNNCNGLIDENLTKPCQGFCEPGVHECKNGEWTPCNAPMEKTNETCNGFDDDCNGEIDDGLKRPCTDTCGKGIQYCTKGQWTRCQNDPTQKYEECNGKDDDCDGLVDENLQRPCETPCGKGVQACIRGDWSTCSAPQPHAEVCDGKDNDCNGKIDDNTSCTGRCVDGFCQLPCTDECPAGFLCADDNYCQPKPCASACQDGTVCKLGACVPQDCTAPSSRCLPNEICQQKRCIPDPCLGVSCAQGRFCREGTCRLSCANITCPTRSLCKDGICERNPCANRSCLFGKVCREDRGAGECVAYTCTQNGDCGPGRLCKQGQCIEEICAQFQCPQGQVCMDGDCYDPQHPNLKPSQPPASSGFPSAYAAKACGCSSTPSPPPLMWASLLLFALLTRRNRSTSP